VEDGRDRRANRRAGSPERVVGHRYGEPGRWNLRLDGVRPALSVIDRASERVPVALSRFDIGEGERGSIVRRGVPAMRVGGRLVTTVLDLLLARYGVVRPGLPGDWPSGYDDPGGPPTPAWQESITGVDRHLAVRVAREFARNAELTRGRSMIAMGAGTNHWFHSDQTYRSFLSLVMLCGCQGVNGGGWAHYVGQEKVRPLAGWQTVAFALDWVRPPRQQSGTPFFYLATGQWRYERYRPSDVASPLGRGMFDGMHIVDVNALGARLGWLPSFPSFDRSTLDLCDEAREAGLDPPDYVVRDYPNVAAQWGALGPLVEGLGTAVKGVKWVADEEVAELRATNGAVRGGIADGRPSLVRVQDACEAILALSGTTNGRLAVEGSRSMEMTTGLELAALASPREGDRISFHDAQVQPRTVITSPEWSGIEAHGRRYSPFTMNV
jgi:nitrate reductase alpha subunit